MSDRLCILGLDKLNDNYLNIFRPVCLFYKMKSIFPKHIKSWLGVCAAICGVCAKNAPDTMQELSKQFISTDVFTYKDTNNSQIQLADIPFTEYKFVLDNDLSYIFNICKKIIRRAQLQLTDFIAVCEYPDDIPCDELFDDTFEYDDAEASNIQQAHHDIENIESEQASASEDETPEQRTLQADQITNTTNYEAFAPIALIINNGDDENLLRLTATTWRDIVTQLFDYLSAQDEGILRRYYRNSPSTSVITDRKDEIARDSEPLCNSEYRFKAGCSVNDLVTAIPDIINQSMFSTEQFAIDYIRANASHNAQDARAIEAEIDTIQKKYFQEALTELDANPAPSPSTKYSPNAPKGEYVSFAQPKDGMAVTAYGVSARYTDLEHIDLQKYTHTKATAVYYDGECVAEVNSWRDAYYEVFVLIQKRFPSFYGPYRKVNCLYPVSKMSSFVDARGECHAVQIPHTDYCIDVKKSVVQIIRDLKKVVALSALDGSLLFITYAHTEKSLARQEEQDESFEQPVSEPETVAFTQNATEPETTDFEQPAAADEQRITFSTKLDYKNLLSFTRPNAVYYDGKLISTAKQWKLIYFDIFLFVKDKYPSFYTQKKYLPYIYPLEGFDPVTLKIGARDARRIPGTDKCIILGKDVPNICSDLYDLCNDSPLDGSKLVITYTQSNRYSRTSRASNPIEPPKPVAATVSSSEYADFSTAKTPGYAGVSTAKTPDYADVSTTKTPEYADFSTAKTPGYAGVSPAITPGYAGVSPAITPEYADFSTAKTPGYAGVSTA
ncbi:MAG: hypothetical protein IJ268_12145, partial [Proteobacteria bacterium]|nr:hypothetical protein [Pseudomonadota bacterium]